MRRTICIGCLFATLLGVAADSASASTLLSGYGGPGQGNQASLGSALLNGPKGGGRNSRGGSGGGSAASASTGSSASAGAGGGGSEQAASGTGSGAGSATGSSRAAATNGGQVSPGRGRGARTPAASKGQRGGHGSRGGNVQTGQTPSGAATTATGLYPASERIPAGESSDALGVSGSDLLYIVLAFAALAIVAVLTRGLTRPAEAGRGG